MASFCSALAMLMVFMVYSSSSSLASTSQVHLQFTAISAAPAFLPEAPLASSPSLSPDITPLFPSPAGTAPSPMESSLPTIPSSPSPPNPDDMLAPGPEMAFQPSGSSFAMSSAVSLASSGPILLLGFVAFCLMQLSGV